MFGLFIRTLYLGFDGCMTGSIISVSLEPHFSYRGWFEIANSFKKRPIIDFFVLGLLCFMSDEDDFLMSL